MERIAVTQNSFILEFIQILQAKNLLIPIRAERLFQYIF